MWPSFTSEIMQHLITLKVTFRNSACLCASHRAPQRRVQTSAIIIGICKFSKESLRQLSNSTMSNLSKPGPMSFLP